MKAKIFFSLMLSGVFTLSGYAQESNNQVLNPGQIDHNELCSKVSGLRIPWISNQGQMSREVAYYAGTFTGTVFIKSSGDILYKLPFDKTHSLLLTEKTSCEVPWAPSCDIKIKPEDPGYAKVNYFKGNDPDQWRTDIQTINTVSLGEAWPGIELKVRAYGTNIEKLFCVRPGGDPSAIRMQFDEDINLYSGFKGDLVVCAHGKNVKFTRPLAYQIIDGRKQFVDVSYHAEGNRYGFVVGHYNRDYCLVIDPLLASTYLGGTSDEIGYSVAIADDGNVFVGGSTMSSDFPVAGSPYCPNLNSTDAPDVFVSKLNPDLSTLLASTFLGGISGDECYVVMPDKLDYVFVSGVTESDNFPTSLNCYDDTYNGGKDIFIAKLGIDLDILYESTYLGEAEDEVANAIALDFGPEHVYITGYTNSVHFPIVGTAFDTTYNGGDDIYLAIMSPHLHDVYYSTFLGGMYRDIGWAIALDPSGIYVAGESASPDYPVAGNPFSGFISGDVDGVISRLDYELNNLDVSTFIGGTLDDRIYSMTITNPSEHLYFTGETYSSDYPTLTSAYDPDFNGATDVFVSRMTLDLQDLTASTFVGGSDYDAGKSIVIDYAGNIFVAGYSNSSDYPAPGTPAFGSLSGMYDVVISRLVPDLTILSVSTYLGGTGNDKGYSIALNGAGDVYVTGLTVSTDFPTRGSSFDTEYNGGWDAFVSNFDHDLSASAGIDDILDRDKVRVYPNPADDILTIESAEPCLLEVFDISGKKVLQSHQKMMNISCLDEGTYIITAKSFKGEIIKTDKLMIVH